MNQPDETLAETPPVVEERTYVGWITICLIVAFLVLGQLSLYLGAERKDLVDDLQLERDLKLHVRLKSLPGGATDATESLEEAKRSVEPRASKDVAASLLYAEISTELGEPVDVKKLGPLKDSKVERQRLAYVIYSSPKLTEKQARDIIAKLPEEKFLYRLASAHALEKAGVENPRAGLSDERSAVLLVLAGLGLMFFFGLGALLLFIYSIVRASGRLVPSGLAVGLLSKPAADRLATRSSQLFLLFLGVSILGPAFLSGTTQKDYAEVPMYLALVLMILLVSRMPVQGRKFDLAMLGVTRENLGKNVLWGAAAAIANVPIVMILAVLGQKIFSSLPPAEHPVTVELEAGVSPLLVLKLILTAAVAAPFIEELMFRGTLFPALTGVLRKPWVAGLLSSLMFAAIHPTGIPAWPALAGIGGMSCFLAYQTRSLVPSMVMHAIHNFGTLVFSLMLLR